jgi:hypothetical protein
MSVDSKTRPGSICMFCGVVFLGLSAARLATGWSPGPGSLWFELFNGVVGGSLLLWGWSRLCRAKAARPDLTWWQFLHIELVALAIMLVFFPIFAAMSAEQHKSLLTAMLELANFLRMARGEP